MMLQIYTIIHTLISLVAIFTGFVVVFGLLAGKHQTAGRQHFSVIVHAGSTTCNFMLTRAERG